MPAWPVCLPPEMLGWPQALVDDISAAVYNVVFTSVPILLFAVLDRPVMNLNTLLRFPQARPRRTAGTAGTASGCPGIPHRLHARGAHSAQRAAPGGQAAASHSPCMRAACAPAAPVARAGACRPCPAAR